MSDYRNFKVGVFDDPERPNRLPTAYTLWYDPRWKGCCEHTVSARTGKEAKRTAILQHVKACLCIESEP